MRRKFSFSERLRYRFDNLMSKGTLALIAWLFLATTVMIFIIALLARLTPDGRQIPILRIAWMGLMRTLDAGTMGGDDGSWPFLLLMFFVTMGGVFVVGSLIGILTNGLDEKLTELRKGRSLVVEQDHTVILGWSPQIFPIISELVIANESRRKPCIVILADQDKVEMEDLIKSRLGELKNTRVVCRSGSPIDLKDLEVVNLHDARSIIILSPETERPDADVIKTILAITNNPARRSEPYHIVASLRDEKNLDVALLAGRGEVKLILVDELISRITAQTCRQTGLSVVYTELMDFEGNEIYFQHESQLDGKPFHEALFSYEDSTVIGIRQAAGKVVINPPQNTELQPGDQLIMIAEDDSKIQLSPNAHYPIDHSVINTAVLAPFNTPERTLVLGWNHRAKRVFQELDSYVAAGSQITVVSDMDEASMADECDCERFINERVDFLKGDTTSRAVLEKLDVPSYDHIIILSDSDVGDIQEADARTMITLLHLRDMAYKNQCDFAIVSEIMDIANRQLAEVAEVDDFIVSDKLISLMISQVSENGELMDVFADLFNPIGSEVYLKSIGDYIRLGEPVAFCTLVEAAWQRGQIAIGYRLVHMEHDSSRSYGVVINPKKSDKITFTEKDKLIVLAEN